MRRVLLRRSHLQSSLDFIQNLIASRYIARKNVEFAHARGQRLAVYANDWIGAKIYLEGVYEKQNIDDLFDILQRVGIDVSRSTAVDVGANIGNHTVVFASKFARVEAFEPNPHTFKLLSFNADHLPNVALHNCGLGDESAVLTMSEDEANYGKSSAVHRHTGGASIDIRVKRLDDYSDAFGDIKFIKIDVEGMEHRVLLGARRILKKDRPVVAFEQHQSEFVAGEEETPSIRCLREHGYEIIWSEVVGKDRPFIVRRLRNIYDLFFGKTVRRVMVTDRIVPSASHSMLVAVPKERMESMSAPDV